MKKYQIYTDGSSRGNPGPGGWGVAVFHDNTIVYAEHDFCSYTTNNREELKSILQALQFAAERPKDSFTIYSDSAYCVNICTNWIETWAKNNWKNSKKQTVENLDLIKELYSYLHADPADEWQVCNFRIEKVEGHVGLIGNEIADALATNNTKKFDELIIAHNILEEYIL